MSELKQASAPALQERKAARLRIATGRRSVLGLLQGPRSSEEDIAGRLEAETQAVFKQNSPS